MNEFHFDTPLVIYGCLTIVVLYAILAGAGYWAFTRDWGPPRPLPPSAGHVPPQPMPDSAHTRARGWGDEIVEVDPQQALDIAEWERRWLANDPAVLSPIERLAKQQKALTAQYRHVPTRTERKPK